LAGVQVSRPVSTDTGSSSTMVAGVKPAVNAAAYTNGLNADPGCRFAAMARLKPPRS
jgi:hypothetical protein